MTPRLNIFSVDSRNHIQFAWHIQSRKIGTSDRITIKTKQTKQGRRKHSKSGGGTCIQGYPHKQKLATS